MKRFFKSYWKTLLFFGFIGLLGGFFTGIYLLDSYPADIQQMLTEELHSMELGQFPEDILLGIISAVQAAGYGLALGAAGIGLSKKIGLWHDEISITKKPLIQTAVISVIGGMTLILSDILFFGKYVPAIMDSYAAKPTLAYMLATVTYGAVIEEVMMRLFFMSLLAFLLHKLFSKGCDKPSDGILITANMIASLLFAAGHLPATFQLLGSTPLIIFRCFLLNGIFGLLFGRLYRKYGLRYAMIAHGGCHLVSKLIWIMFI